MPWIIKENKKKMLINIKNYIVDLIENELSNSNSKWKSTNLFYSIKELSIDQRGRIGEHFLRDVFKALNFNVFYNNNATGDYDIEINNYKVEIKTATLGVNNKFQHEGIKESQNWDLIAFVDISPDNLYLSFIPRKSFKFSIDGGTKYNKKRQREEEYVYGTLNWKEISQKIHYRGKDNTKNKATGQGYKVDLKIEEINQVKTIKDIENAFKEAMC